MVKIENVIPNSTAAKAGLNSKDKIITINGQEINDYIDYLYQISEPIISLKLKTKDNQIKKIELERKLGEELGIEFKEIVFDGLKQCKNNCIFCFVKQQPQNMRSSLNQMDDDYRFSFLQGSFVTLTNLEAKEIQRIIDKNLSPINISVHTTNPELRVEMMKNPKAADINRLLKLFQKNNIQFHTQIVLCPEYNDQEELDKTLKDLLAFYPQILSIGIVPVGITKYREGLSDLRTLTPAEMQDSLAQIEYWQQKSKKMYGENIIYAADEFYLNTDSELPNYQEYNDFPQLENGIGLTALMNHELEKVELPESLSKVKNTAVMTSVLGKKSLNEFAEKIKKIDKLKLELKVVKNEFFGETVTVTGLLTAQDLKKNIKKINPIEYDQIFISEIVLNDQNKFLDEQTKEEFIDELSNYKIKFVSNLKELMEVIKNG
ncbi:putative radical SAM enzyme, TIGR03279 family [Halanaerobium congolense]|jgi:putative radical SAM enzyme (TIGR03279 family)|uniref:Putative radical SAM enzyme (TIGR03279 family) n=2 Tax=Halanaerobium congolense TaxID=54121 RepID=A0A1G6HRC5_9FIRM|nr:putative radical SAM enzyme (TIGR03279 family) [Halanaerobium congolense]TDS33026.1 putative radical SAM enzyme (TIGR03279 family) [Halanaerobium congolense]SDB96780.1 putative radical SAM enzyme, TIGR03279 family [Halanaerobium congolense]